MTMLATGRHKAVVYVDRTIIGRSLQLIKKSLQASSDPRHYPVISRDYQRCILTGVIAWQLSFQRLRAGPSCMKWIVDTLLQAKDNISVFYVYWICLHEISCVHWILSDN